MNARCPGCKNKIVQKVNGRILVRVGSALSFSEDGNVTGKCYWCKREVEFPLKLSLDEDIQLENETFYIKH